MKNHRLSFIVLVASATLAYGQSPKDPQEIAFEDGFDYRLEYELQMVCIENDDHADTPIVKPSEFGAIPADKLLGYMFEAGGRKVVITNLHEYWTEFDVEDDPSAALARRGVAIRPIPRSAAYASFVQQFMPAFRYRYERRVPGGSPSSYQPVSAWSEWQILPKSQRTKKQGSEQAGVGGGDPLRVEGFMTVDPLARIRSAALK